MTRLLRPDEQRTWTGYVQRQTYGRFGVQDPGFDHVAAETIYKAIAGCPDDESARLHAVVLLDGLIQHELITKGTKMAAAADEIAKARAEVLDKRLARAALAKARNRESAADELAGMALLHKAFDFTDEERQRFLSTRHRDLHSGRFVREHRSIDYDPRFEGLQAKEATRIGIEEPAKLSGTDRARFQEAYHQIAQMVAPFKGVPNSLIHLHVHDAQGPKETRLVAMPPASGSLQLQEHVKRGEHIAAASVSTVPPTTAAGAAFDALAPMSGTAAGVAYHTVEQGAGSADRLHGFSDELGRKFDQDAHIPSQRVFRNIESSSKLLRDSIGPAAPPKLKMALAVGEHVGRYGPEAQKVIGPTADKAAYRYRGTERALPEPLHNSIAQLSTLDVGDKSWYLAHGNAKPDGTLPAGGWNPSGVLLRLREMLPSADLNNLHLKSGAVPPSRGVVFDKDGKASVLAVGYGDDHYLPFNLRGRSFRAMRGGEYLRTRTFGGPTTEDVYASLIGGARRFAVVSHNGVFTVDYAEDLKGGKRFNDNAARMVARYGYLLDAVKSEQVTTGGIAASRRAELKARAEQRYPEASHGDKHKEEYDRLLEHETKYPELSAQQKDRAALDFFARHADLGPGAGGLRQTMIASYINTEAADRWAQARAPYEQHNREHPERQMVAPSLESFQSQVRDEISGLPASEQAGRYAKALGLGDEFAAHMKGAEAENKERLTPLRLNGVGYDKALQALQEEFPHYITGVSFHPWTEASRAGRPDTGYVRPRHNRAAAALSGYFDSVLSTQGRGKVFADSTRHQNRNETLRPYESPAERKAEAKQKTDAPKADAGTAAALREDADLALFDAVKGSATFNPGHAAMSGAAGEVSAGALKGYRVGDALEDRERGRPVLEAAAPNLVKLFEMPREDFVTLYRERPDEARKLLSGAKRENDEKRLLDIAPGIGSAFDRGGKPAPKKALGDHPSAHLNSPDEDISFDEPAYDAAMSPKTAQVEAEYSTHPLILGLVASKDLPDRITDEGFETKANRIVDALKERRRVLMGRMRSGEQVPDDAWRAVDEPAEGVLRAKQLHRRHARAAEAEREATVLTQQPGEASSVTMHNSVSLAFNPQELADMDEDDLAKLVDRLKLLGDNTAAQDVDVELGRRSLGSGRVIDQ